MIADLETAASGLSILMKLEFLTWHAHSNSEFFLDLDAAGFNIFKREFLTRKIFLSNLLSPSSLPFVMSKTHWEKRETHIIQELTMNSGTFECLLLLNCVSQWCSFLRWERIAVLISSTTWSEAFSWQPLRQAFMCPISWAAMPMSSCKSVLLTITSPNTWGALSPAQLILAIDRGFCQGGKETLARLSNTTGACEKWINHRGQQGIRKEQQGQQDSMETQMNVRNSITSIPVEWSNKLIDWSFFVHNKLNWAHALNLTLQPGLESNFTPDVPIKYFHNYSHPKKKNWEAITYLVRINQLINDHTNPFINYWHRWIDYFRLETFRTCQKWHSPSGNKIQDRDTIRVTVLWGFAVTNSNHALAWWLWHNFNL